MPENIARFADTARLASVDPDLPAIYEGLTFNVHGRVISPGVYQGEFAFAPYFHHLGSLCGETEEGDDMPVDDDDREIFPELLADVYRDQNGNTVGEWTFTIDEQDED